VPVDFSVLVLMMFVVLVMAVSSLAAVLIIALRSSGPRALPVGRTRANRRRAGLILPSPSLLDVALESAAEANPYRVGGSEISASLLEGGLKSSPPNCEAAIQEISQAYRDGRVISLDLQGMSISAASRVIDFCSGMMSVDLGWLFRISSLVIVVTPGSRRGRGSYEE
jgi:hypothetical protein